MGTVTLDMLPGHVNLGNVSRQCTLDHVISSRLSSWHGSGSLSLSGVQDGALGCVHVARYEHGNTLGTCVGKHCVSEFTMWAGLGRGGGGIVGFGRVGVRTFPLLPFVSYDGPQSSMSERQFSVLHRGRFFPPTPEVKLRPTVCAYPRVHPPGASEGRRGVGSVGGEWPQLCLWNVSAQIPPCFM